jgi:hypothetical protein
MRLKAPTAAAMSLVCVLLCSAPLLAKPTRPVAHESARRPLILTPSHETSRLRSSHRPANTVAAHRPDTLHHASSRPASIATSRKVTHSWTPTHAEARAKAAYAANDSAALDRVHAWELTHRNPPASDHSASASNDTAPTQTLLANDDAISGLIRTTPELPRAKTIEEEATTPLFLPSLRVSSLYDQRGRLVLPAPLYGSHEVLLHQNQMANHDGLDRVRDDADLLDLRRDKKLVALPTNETLRVDDRLPANRRFSRPWTADFLAVLAHDYYASFHEPLQVNSAVRTVEFQQRLLHTNGNAAPSTGDTASPHLTGQAIDIAKRGLTVTEIAWMRTYLAPLIDQGKIDVEEEFQQSCFHISVYRNYLPPIASHITVAAARQAQTDPSY